MCSRVFQDVVAGHGFILLLSSGREQKTRLWRGEGEACSSWLTFSKLRGFTKLSPWLISTAALLNQEGWTAACLSAVVPRHVRDLWSGATTRRPS